MEVKNLVVCYRDKYLDPENRVINLWHLISRGSHSDLMLLGSVYGNNFFVDKKLVEITAFLNSKIKTKLIWKKTMKLFTNQ